MLHPHTSLRYVNELIGHGVFATAPIPKGTITWVSDYLDRELTPIEVESLHEPLKEVMLTYCYRTANGNFFLCWDHTKYINHSFNANCMTTPYNFEIAVRDIAEGEQLTNDYGTLNIIEPFEPCDEGTERKIIYPNDLAKYYKVWDAQIQEAIGFIAKVHQPLHPFFELSHWDDVVKLAQNNLSHKSLLECWYNESDNI